MKKLLTTATAVLLTASMANAGTVSIVDITGHNGGQRFGFPVGNLPNVIDGSGMTRPDLNDPSTWTATSNAWQNEWQSNALLSSGINNKIGWVAIDLGSEVTQLDEMYLWNERENSNRPIGEYNVYYASSPGTALPAQPGEQQVAADVGFGPGDYDFSSAGWTQLGGTNTMSWRNVDGANVNDIVNLGGISAQYIAIEILSNGGDANRVGLAEVAVTRVDSVVPSPTAALAGLIGLAGLASRRRRG